MLVKPGASDELYFGSLRNIKIMIYVCLYIFPIKINFEICSKQLLTMSNRFLILPMPEKLNFNEFLRFKDLKADENVVFPKKWRKSILQHAILCKKMRRKRLYYQFWAKPSRMTCFCQNTFLTFLTFCFLYLFVFWATRF